MTASTVADDLKAMQPEARFVAASILTRLGITGPAEQLAWLQRTIPPADGYDWEEMVAGIWSFRRLTDSTGG